MKKLILLLCVLFPSVSYAQETQIPQAFEVYYGNGLFGYSTLKLDKDKISYEAHERGNVKKDIITPTPEQWQAFRKTLDALDVWEWKSDYANEGATDGTQWNLIVKYSEKSITSKGSNSFPQESGAMTNSSAPGPYFQKFLDALTKLTGKEIR